MSRAEVSAPTGARIGAVVLTVLLHGAAVFALIRAFAPDLPGQVAEQVLAAFTIDVPDPPRPPPPPSPPPPSPDAKPQPAGAAAPEGRKAVPKEVAAPAPRIVIAQKTAPKAASTGSADSAGASDRGEGTGAGGAGTGTGSGTGGAGTGGGGIAVKAVKLSGDINSARDYPRATRDLRIGDHVDVALTVGTDGRVKGCRVVRASRDAEANGITCRLATERFRFRPATDAGGKPVESVFGWRQRWFYPDKNS